MRHLVGVPAADLARLVIAVRSALDGSGPAVLPFAEGADAAVGIPREVPVATAVVIATSGSTGAPKLVALRASALLGSAAATDSALGGPGSWLMALPGHYIAGVQVMVRAIAAGGEPFLLPPGTFQAAAFATAVERMPAETRRYSSLVPTQLHRLLDATDGGDRRVAEALRSLDAVLIGGARLAPALAERAEAVGIRVRRTYGSSETAGGCVYDGVPLAGVGVRIAGGEVQLSGPTLADGYLGDAARTTASFVDEPGERWYRTGDTGAWDGTRLTVTGRLDDVIISGGEKVSLALVEAAVRDLGGLDDAIVVRMPDAEWGEVPIVVTTARAVDLAALRVSVAGLLGRAAAPSRVVTLDAIPLLSTGKPDRRALERLATGSA